MTQTPSKRERNRLAQQRHRQRVKDLRNQHSASNPAAAHDQQDTPSQGLDLDFSPVFDFDCGLSGWDLAPRPTEAAVSTTHSSPPTLSPPDDPASKAQPAQQPYCSLLNGRIPRGRTPLHMLAESSPGNVLTALLASGADHSATDEYGITPVHVAARRGNVAALEVLLAAGAPLEARDGHGWTALHHAAWCGWADAVALLVARGASVDVGVGDGPSGGAAAV